MVWMNDEIEDASPWRWLIYAAIGGGFTVYLIVASLATVVFPVVLPVFLAPFLLLALFAFPQGKAAPKRLVMFLLYSSAILLPLWPVYIHAKISPLPIITPPRMILYALSAIWIWDMLASRLRRGQFLVAMKRGAPISYFVLAFFAVSFLSLPMAEGRSLAAQEFIRQAIIWLLPFCIAATYIRRERDLVRIVTVLTIAAVVNAAIAVFEKLTGTLLAQLLSPFITGNAEWLQITQSQKIRDGVFRAQGTHTHPLSVGEFIALTTPFAIVFAVRARHIIQKLSWTGATIILAAGAVATSSRGAALAIIVSLLVTICLIVHRAVVDGISVRSQPIVALMVLFLMALAPIGVIAGKKVISGGGGVSTTNSSQARVDQIEMAWPKILKRPVGGYGTGRATRILGYWGRSLTIDNYYLTLALDLGFPGPLIFLGLLLSIISVSYRRSRDGPKQFQLMYVGFIAAFVAFATTRTIVSMVGNLSYMYLLFGALAGASVYLKPRKTKEKFEY